MLMYDYNIDNHRVVSREEILAEVKKCQDMFTSNTVFVTVYGVKFYDEGSVHATMTGGDFQQFPKRDTKDIMAFVDKVIKENNERIIEIRG